MYETNVSCCIIRKVTIWWYMIYCECNFKLKSFLSYIHKISYPITTVYCPNILQVDKYIKTLSSNIKYWSELLIAYGDNI